MRRREKFMDIFFFLSKIQTRYRAYLVSVLHYERLSPICVRVRHPIIKVSSSELFICLQDDEYISRRVPFSKKSLFTAERPYSAILDEKEFVLRGQPVIFHSYNSLVWLHASNLSEKKQGFWAFVLCIKEFVCLSVVNRLLTYLSKTRVTRTRNRTQSRNLVADARLNKPKRRNHSPILSDYGGSPLNAQ